MLLFKCFQRSVRAAMTSSGECCAARENIIGWYSTGPRLRPADLDINGLICKYCTDPILVICEVKVCSSGQPPVAGHSRAQLADDHAWRQTMQSAVIHGTHSMHISAQLGGCNPVYDRLSHSAASARTDPLEY